MALGMLLWISAPEWPPGRPVSSSVQSFPEAGRRGMIETLKALADGCGGAFSRRGDYPAWEYRPASRLRDVMVRVCRERTGKEPVVETIHAGLECGLLAQKLPGLDAVSGSMACTPLGAERMRPTALRVSSGERASAGAWLAQVKEQTAPDFSSWNFSGAFSVWSSGRTNTALARSGMALS